MNNFLIYRFPERIKRIYKSHFPNDENVTYGNLPNKIENKLDNFFAEEDDIIPNTKEAN